MTVYAIVNNLFGDKTLCENPVWTVVSPSAILQGGNPYFVPDFDSRFEARPALAVRIGKLGKGIAPRFAHRYVDGVAPASMMIARNLLENLKKSELPWSKAISYDRSLAVGQFSNLPIEEISSACVSLDIVKGDDLLCFKCQGSDLQFPIEEIISVISRDNALKTGDYIIVASPQTGLILEPGPRVELRLNDETPLRFNIR